MRVLMIITGGIACYKSLYTIRLLKTAGVDVRCIMTQSAQQFITPLSVSALTGDHVYTDLFSLTDESDMGHIKLARDADLVLVTPATANTMAQVAHGMANDLATTALLATDAPIYMTPAMNPHMWANPATQANVDILHNRGITLIAPDRGDMACGETGTGRMAEPPHIARVVLDKLGVDSGAVDLDLPVAMVPDNAHDLAGRKILVTAGATVEDIDGVRFLSNYSSGKQGYAIASAFAQRGALVTLVSGQTQLPCPHGVDRVVVKSAHDMLGACERTVADGVDGAVFCAAVADWGVAHISPHKIKKTGDTPPTLNLTQNPDILHTVATGANRPPVVVGFASETENLMANATDKLNRKNADLIVANLVGGTTDTFGSDDNTVHFVTAHGQTPHPKQSKTAVAHAIADWVAEQFCNL